MQRIGGEAEFIAYATGDKVVDAYFISTAPIRGFERIVRGKNPIFAVNTVMRICGICHIAHGIACVSAIENALGITPPPNGRVIREILGLVNRIQSHIIHLILITPDIISKEYVNEVFTKEVELLNKISDFLARLGGAPTHPPNIVIGGVEKVPDQKTLNLLTKSITDIAMLFEEIYDYVMDKSKWNSVPYILMKKKLNNLKFLATHLFYGDYFSIDVSKIKILRYEEWRKGNIPKEAKINTTLVSLYNNTEVETGPRARLTLFKGFEDKSMWGLQVARLKEIKLDIERILDLLSRIEPNKPGRLPRVFFGEGKGVGVYEAPRGTLIHWIEIGADGRIISYNIVVPTMFNVPWMERFAIGIPAKYVDVIPRIYDPCIPCSTHVIKLQGVKNV